MIRGTTTFSPSERAANVRMVVVLVAVVWKDKKVSVGEKNEKNTHDAV